MDNRIRRNEKCVIGQPTCDYVFSSTRSCFIAYGFDDSPMEKNVLKRLLEDRKIEPVEAGSLLAAGENIFCTKICSKIIQAQFCAVFINHEISGRKEIPNANVSMEYGLMLGFNKHIVPFQREGQRLPFNVAGLGTVIYTGENYEQKAAEALDRAIRLTQQSSVNVITFDQTLEFFLLSQRALVTPILNDAEKIIYKLGEPLGFSLLNDFSGLRYMFLGNFTDLRAEAIAYRVSLLASILNDRREAIKEKIQGRLVSQDQADAAQRLFASLDIWIVALREADRVAVEASLPDHGMRFRIWSKESIEGDARNMLERAY